MTLRIACADGLERERAVAAAVAAVRRGDVVVLPMESVYAIAADAFSARGLATLRTARGTDPGVPVPVMVGARGTVAGLATGVSTQAQSLIDAFWPGPLTLLLRPQPTLAWDLPAGAPVAVRMPLHPLALAVLARTGPLAVTTANLPGLPAPTDAGDALAQMGDLVAVVLDAGGVADDEALPSTVVDATAEVPVVVRVGAVTVESLRRVCPDVRTGPGDPDA